jgi:hypothetical protein
MGRREKRDFYSSLNFVNVSTESIDISLKTVLIVGEALF